MGIIRRQRPKESPGGRLRRRGTPVTLLLAAVLWLPGPLASNAWAQSAFDGLITDGGGTPLVDADLDFFDPVTGQKFSDPSSPPGQSDKTDAFGRYSMTIVPATYDVRFEPPTGRVDLAPVWERNLDLTTDVVLDVVLPFGARLTGTVTDSAGSPVAGVDFDFRNPVTREKAATVDDDTAADGTYGVTVLPGVYDVVLKPPVGVGVSAIQVDRVDVTTNAVLDVMLPPGYLVTGSVQDGGGSPVVGADLDVDARADGRRIPTADDKTLGDGSYVIALPPGRCDVFVTPPAGSPLAPGALYDVTITSGINFLPTVVLDPAVSLGGTVRDPDGLPMVGADLDLFVAGTGDRYPATAGFTDSTGAFHLLVAAGAYDLLVKPPTDSPFGPFLFDGIVVAADTTVSLDMPAETPARQFAASQILDPDDAPVSGAAVEGTPLDPSGEAWITSTDAAGSFGVWVLPGPYRVDVTPPAGSGLEPLTLASVDLPAGLAAGIRLTATTVAPPAPVPPPPLYAAPNPWVASTSLWMELDAARTGVLVEIYDLTGRRVRTLRPGPLPAGPASVVWDGLDQGGRRAAAGVYIVHVSGAGLSLVTKIVRVAR
jgi:protocatechuate 3,4-dioxygenase beta subunit